MKVKIEQVTEDEYIEKLYNIVIESKNHHDTFIKYIDIWKKFYNNREYLFKKNILNEKLFTIIKFLLENEKGEIFDYFHDNIIELLNKEQTNLIFSIRDSSNYSENDIHKLFTNLRNHDDLCSFLKYQNMNDVFGNVKSYQSKTIELYTIDGLIIPLYHNFFSIHPEIVRKTVNYISNNPILFQQNNIKNNIMNKDLIFQYIEKVIPIKEFLGEKIDNDLLIKQIKNYKIKDKKLLIKVLDTLNYNQIFKIFDYNLENFIIFLEQADYLTEVEKQSIIQNIFNKFLKNESINLLPLIVNNNQSILWKRYFTDEIYKKIITDVQSAIPINFASYELKYLLENNLISSHFKINISHLLKQNELFLLKNDYEITDLKKQVKKSLSLDWAGINTITKEQRTINKEDSLKKKASKSVVKDLLGETISLSDAIELLKSHLSKEINLTEIQAMAIIRSITLHSLRLLKIENNGVYFYNNDYQNNAYFIPSCSMIGINKKRISTLLNPNIKMYNRLSIFDTIFHEIKHAKIHHQKLNNIWDIESYEMEKETILKKYDCNFYKTNYNKIKEEIQARISGNKMMSKFIELYFPEYLDTIQNDIIKNLEKENQLKEEQTSEREMDFLGKITISFHQGFDTLIKYNPNILEKYPILQLEYNTKGIPKTYEEICLSKTDENEELIDNIIAIRYPESQKHKYH